MSFRARHLLGIDHLSPPEIVTLLDLAEGGEAHIPELAHMTRSGRRYRVDAKVFAVCDPQGARTLSMVFARPEDSGGLIDMRHVFGGSVLPEPTAMPAPEEAIFRPRLVRRDH